MFPVISEQCGPCLSPDGEFYVLVGGHKRKWESGTYGIRHNAKWWNIYTWVIADDDWDGCWWKPGGPGTVTTLSEDHAMAGTFTRNAFDADFIKLREISFTYADQ
jgi:hypothetical protein